jgi:hypothetical protein
VIFLGAAITVLMAWAAVLEWRAWSRRKAARRTAARRWAANLQAAARHPSRQKALTATVPMPVMVIAVPGLPVDGKPLTRDEYDQFTGIMMRPARDPETGYGPGQDERETR